MGFETTTNFNAFGNIYHRHLERRRRGRRGGRERWRKGEVEEEGRDGGGRK